MTRTLGSRSRARKRRALSPAFLARTWKPGESGNPSGHSGLYGEAISLARQAAPDAVRRLIELMQSDDERCAAVACNSILDRAFGRVKQAEDPPSEREELEAMTPEERRAEMQRLVDKARGVLAGDRPVIEGEAVEAEE
jgi:hypothetical protein